ncbi:hypothetical protein KTF22_03325 [Burkholderia multivorans]|uniref:hypothetical protein n=1 Tax=Burkholderia multivorans TaxID=87883 RepID=UPI001C24C8E2|nr:hypothetical protein [Burkholderia multivorans]MBU9660923.1 hypothetical protein [Burkholderia multivorans]
MFSLDNTLAKIVSVTNVSEKHGTERKPAITVGMSVVVGGDVLGEFDPALRAMLYRKPLPKPGELPILRDGEPIRVGAFGEDFDPASRIYLHRSVARLDKGIPNPKERPVLPLPWSLEFTLDIYPNKEIKEQEIRNLIEEGGLAIGLGTFRGVFGKFIIEAWE